MQTKEPRGAGIRKLMQTLSDRPVLHFNGKLLLDIVRYHIEQVNRIAVILTGEDTEFLLGIPIVADSLSLEEAPAILKMLKNKALITVSFDTMATNTGMIQGACLQIKQDLDHDLLWLA